LVIKKRSLSCKFEWLLGHFFLLQSHMYPDFHWWSPHLNIIFPCLAIQVMPLYFFNACCQNTEKVLPKLAYVLLRTNHGDP
jgi:hypothetical protein